MSPPCSWLSNLSPPLPPQNSRFLQPQQPPRHRNSLPTYPHPAGGLEQPQVLPFSLPHFRSEEQEIPPPPPCSDNPKSPHFHSDSSMSPRHPQEAATVHLAGLLRIVTVSPGSPCTPPSTFRRAAAQPASLSCRPAGKGPEAPTYSQRVAAHLSSCPEACLEKPQSLLLGPRRAAACPSGLQLLAQELPQTLPPQKSSLILPVQSAQSLTCHRKGSGSPPHTCLVGLHRKAPKCSIRKHDLLSLHPWPAPDSYATQTPSNPIRGETGIPTSLSYRLSQKCPKAPERAAACPASLSCGWLRDAQRSCLPSEEQSPSAPSPHSVGLLREAQAPSLPSESSILPLYSQAADFLGHPKLSLPRSLIRGVSSPCTCLLQLA